MASDPKNAPETAFRLPPKTYIRGSDDLDYEDLTARLLNEPAKTGRNYDVLRLKALQEQGRLTADQAKAILAEKDRTGDYTYGRVHRLPDTHPSATT